MLMMSTLLVQLFSSVFCWLQTQQVEFLARVLQPRDTARRRLDSTRFRKTVRLDSTRLITFPRKDRHRTADRNDEEQHG